MKKRTLGAVFALLITLGSLTTGATTAEAALSKAPTAEKTQALKKPEVAKDRTLLITSDSRLKGAVLPYNTTTKKNGIITLQYRTEQKGFIDGDASILTIDLPDAFKYLTTHEAFRSYIRGIVTTKTWLGFSSRTSAYNPSDITVYPDRIELRNPGSLWLISGSLEANIVIDYGTFLRQWDPAHQIEIPVSDTPLTFTADMHFESFPWDFLNRPICGTMQAAYASKENSIIVQ